MDLVVSQTRMMDKYYVFKHEVYTYRIQNWNIFYMYWHIANINDSVLTIET
jgi:hypothetical protein